MALQKVDYVNQVTVITAENMNDIQDAIIALETAPYQGLSEEVKQALLQLAQKVAYIDDQGQTYYDNLYNALYPPKTVVSITAEFNQGTTVIYGNTALDDLKQFLTVTAKYDDNTTSILSDSAYTLSGLLEAPSSTVTVLYNGVSTTFSVNVTARPTLSSISAVYTQSGTVYDTDTLDSLKADLVVTAHYSDSSTQTIPAADYTLSGDLTHEQTIVDLLDGATWTDGIAFDDNGNQIDRPTLSCSDYLPVTPGTLYTYSKPVSGGTDAYGMGLYLYDSSKGWIGRETSAGTQSGTEYVKTYTPASNVAYVRLMAYVTAKSGAEFTYDATPSSWTSTITVAYGGKTTTFSVTVTKMPVIFTMGGKVFSGSSSDVVNTGIKLLETDRTFSLVCDFINGAVTGDMVLVHCLYEQSPYYGFSFMRNNSVGTYCISGPNTQVLANTATELPSTQGVHNVVVIRHDSSDGRWKIDGTTNGTRITQKSFLPDKTVTGVDAPLVIGAKRSKAGAFSALWKGTVNSLAVYGDFLSDDSVNSILEG